MGARKKLKRSSGSNRFERYLRICQLEMKSGFIQPYKEHYCGCVNLEALHALEQHLVDDWHGTNMSTEMEGSGSIAIPELPVLYSLANGSAMTLSLKKCREYFWSFVTDRPFQIAAEYSSIREGPGILSAFDWGRTNALSISHEGVDLCDTLSICDHFSQVLGVSDLVRWSKSGGGVKVQCSANHGRVLETHRHDPKLTEPGVVGIEVSAPDSTVWIYSKDLNPATALACHAVSDIPITQGWCETSTLAESYRPTALPSYSKGEEGCFAVIDFEVEADATLEDVANLTITKPTLISWYQICRGVLQATVAILLRPGAPPELIVTISQGTENAIQRFRNGIGDFVALG